MADSIKSVMLHSSKFLIGSFEIEEKHCLNCLLYLSLVEFSILSIAIFFVIGFTTMLAQPVTMVWAQKTLPEYKSIVAGFINGFCWGIVALCMSILGAVAQKFGIMNVLVLLSVIPAISSYYVRFLKEKT